MPGQTCREHVRQDAGHDGRSEHIVESLQSFLRKVRVDIVEEIVHVLHCHVEVLQAQFVRPVNIGVQLGWINCLPDCVHSDGLNATSLHRKTRGAALASSRSPSSSLAQENLDGIDKVLSGHYRLLGLLRRHVRHTAIIAYASQLKQPGQIPSVLFLQFPCLDESLVHRREYAAVFARLYALAQQHSGSRIERRVVCARGGEIGVALVSQVSRRFDGLESAFEIRGDFL